MSAPSAGEKRPADGGVDDSSSSSASSSKRAHLLPACPYGPACTRQNPQHKRDFDHSGPPPAEADADKPHCPFGWQCYRANPLHRAEMYHAPAPKVRPLSAFPSPFEAAPDYGERSSSCREPRTLRELGLCRVMGAIRDKPSWWQKVGDEALLSKWRREAEAQGADITQRSWAWAVDELRWQAEQREQDGPIQVAAVDGVFQADGLVDEELRAALLRGVSPLENVPDAAKDWHPGSNQQVLDLVHPSLYCLAYGKTRVTNEPFGAKDALRHFGLGEPKQAEDGPRGDAQYTHSKKFAWLPAEFTMSDDGKSVSIDSYINNLHPTEHEQLYATLASIFAAGVPLLERVLTSLKHPPPLRIVADAYSWYEKPAELVEQERAEKAAKAAAKKDAAAAGSSAASGAAEEEEKSEEGEDDEEENEDDEEHEYDEEDEDAWENRPIYLPDVRLPFRAPSVPADQRVSLAGRQLQVIVKLANIHLTPERPAYNGGSWHVEGMRNEAIVASLIYYYESDNITASQLAFRQAVQEPEYEQSDDRGVGLVYGLANEQALNQPLGAVYTNANRMIAFPNIYQHQVQPFRLADPTRPGHRKILVFFLVDPSLRVTSTANVPPQQSTWLRSAVSQHYWPTFEQCTPLIPPLVSLVLDYADMGVIDQATAFAQREELMSERKFFVQQNSEQLFEREFSLCEH